MDAFTSIQKKESKKKLLSLAGQNPLPYFLTAWLVINLIQISFTELTSDEGYYWFYSTHLQWGYYDHPPMIALIIKLGSSLFSGELGVRFFNVLLSTAGLYLFFTLLPEEFKKSGRTYLILLSAPLLHYLCIIVFPDGPLLFFSLFFLVVYKQFLKQRTIVCSLLLGVAIALMAWSKYHGALVLFFTIFANPKLLKSFHFYLSLLIALVFFAPHLWWQYQNDFPTFRYHLSGRTGNLSFKHVGEFLSQQLLAIGPGLLFIPFIAKPIDVFERTLKVIIIGTFLFFLASSFKTFVHFHWTSITVFPILYFAVKYYHQPDRSKLLNSLIIPFVVLFFAIRLFLTIPIISAMHVGEDYYHGRKIWAKEIQALAGDRPVLMPNNLREASLYSFYTGSLGVTLYTRPEKKSQYELWGYEDSLQGKDVFFVVKYPFAGSQPLKNSLGQNLNYFILPSFTSYYYGIEIIVSAMQQQNDSVEATVEIVNHRTIALLFTGGSTNENTSIVYSLEKDGKLIKAESIQPLASNLLPKENRSDKLTFKVKDIVAGNYLIYFGIRHGVLPDAILSEGIPIKFN